MKDGASFAKKKMLSREAEQIQRIHSQQVDPSTDRTVCGKLNCTRIDPMAIASST